MCHSEFDFSALCDIPLLQIPDSKVISVVLKKGISRWIHRFSRRRKFLNIRSAAKSDIPGYCQKITSETRPSRSPNFLQIAAYLNTNLNRSDLAYTQALRGKMQENGNVKQKLLAYWTVFLFYYKKLIQTKSSCIWKLGIAWILKPQMIWSTVN